MLVQLIVGCFGGDGPCEDFSCAKVPIFSLWFVLFLAVAVVIHEFAHAITAWALNIKVTSIQFGSGKIWFEWLIIGVPWQVRGLPFSGRVTLGASEVAQSRARWIAVVAAAPMTNALSAGVGVWAIWRTEWNFTDVEAAWLAANLWCVVASLWQAEHEIGGQKQMSDGLLIAFLRKAPDAWFELLSMEADSLGVVGKKESTCEFERWNGLGRMIDRKRYLTALLRCIESAPKGSSERTRYLDHLCTWVLFTGDRGLALEVEPQCMELFAVNGQMRTVQGTRGSLLAVSGRLDEGVQILEAMMADDDVVLDRAIGGCTLAWAAHQRGDYQARDSWREEGRRHSGGRQVVEWMEREMDGVPI